MKELDAERTVWEKPQGNVMAIIITMDSFDHLLNCLDNQKFIEGVNADAGEHMNGAEIERLQDENQKAIDDFNRQCRDILTKVEACPRTVCKVDPRLA